MTPELSFLVGTVVGAIVAILFFFCCGLNEK